MTKQEFVNEIARRADLSSRDAAKAVDAFLDAITDTLQSGGEVAFTGFGKFVTQRRAERQGVNPRNPGEKVNIVSASARFGPSTYRSAISQTNHSATPMLVIDSR